jgi:lactoylglutathione lyase
MITNINTVALYVADQGRARDFYTEALGFEVTTDVDMGLMGRWIEVAPPGAKTAFVLSDAAAFKKDDLIGKSADVTLSCSDVRALHSKLVAKGVAVTEPESQDWGTFIKVTDADGHEFVVSQASSA